MGIHANSRLIWSQGKTGHSWAITGRRLSLSIIPPVIGMESLAATADSTLGNSSKDLFGLMEIGLV